MKHSQRRYPYGAFVLVCLLILTFALGGGCSNPEEQAPVRSITEKDPGTEGAVKPVFWIDDEPVTEEELTDFRKRRPGQIAVPEHGSLAVGNSGNALVSPYLRYYSLVQEADKVGLDEDPEFITLYNVGLQNRLGRDYQKFLLSSATYPTERLMSRIPEQWIRMDFELLRFSTDEDAAEALKLVGSSPDDAAEILRSRAIPSISGRNTTGLIWPASGFFDPFDDNYVFTLKVGDISRPVISGVGLAIARVIERQELTIEEQAEYLLNIRQDLTTLAGTKLINQILEVSPPETNIETLSEAIAVEMSRGVRLEKEVVRIGEETLSYRQFRIFMRRPLDYYMKIYKSKGPIAVQNELITLSNFVVLGRAAQADSTFSLAEGFERFEKNLRWDLLYDIFKARYWNQLVVDITDEEIRAFYDENSKLFNVQEGLMVQYYFTPMQEAMEEMISRKEKGVVFEELSRNLSATNVGPHGAGGGIAMKTKNVLRGSNELPTIQDALFAMETGKVQIFQGELGFYLARVESKWAGRVVPFEEVAGRVRATLDQEKRTSAMNRYISDLADQHQIHFMEEKPVQEKAPPFGARG